MRHPHDAAQRSQPPAAVVTSEHFSVVCTMLHTACMKFNPSYPARNCSGWRRMMASSGSWKGCTVRRSENGAENRNKRINTSQRKGKKACGVAACTAECHSKWADRKSWAHTHYPNDTGTLRRFGVRADLSGCKLVQRLQLVDDKRGKTETGKSKAAKNKETKGTHNTQRTNASAR